MLAIRVTVTIAKKSLCGQKAKAWNDALTVIKRKKKTCSSDRMGAVPTKGVWQACPSARGGRYYSVFNRQLGFPALPTHGELKGFHLATGIWACAGRSVLDLYMGPGRAQPRALVKWDLDHDEKPTFLFLFLFAPLVPAQVCLSRWTRSGISPPQSVDTQGLLFGSSFLSVISRGRRKPTFTCLPSSPYLNKWTRGLVDEHAIGIKGRRCRCVCGVCSVCCRWLVE